MLSDISGFEPLDLAVAVAIVDSDPALRSRLATQIGDVAQPLTFPTIDALDAGVPHRTSMVAIFGPSYAGPDGLGVLAPFLRDRPEVAAVLVVDELSTHLLQQAIRSGVVDVITVPADAGQLIESVDRAVANLNAGPVSPAVLAPSSGPPAPRGTVIAVFSAKGGAGKSVVATNLGVSLARRSERPVALVDGDLQFADDAVMLKMVPQHTVADAVGSMARLDASLVRSLLIRHEASGLLVLPGPTEPAFADQVTGEDVSRIVETMREFCSAIVIDLPSYFTDVVIRMLEESDQIVVVSGMDVPNIKNVKLALQTLRLLNVPPEKVRLVLNRANDKVRLDVAEIERALGMKAACLVPSDLAVSQSVNKGVPVVLDAPKSSAAKALTQLAELVVPSPKR